jgi:formate--tetrahydrofolate ligase
VLTDVEINKQAKKEHVIDIAKKLNIDEEDLELYGKYKAKLSKDIYEKNKNNPDGKLILVTSINPTPLGEGKTTIAIGLVDALSRINKKVCLCLREPSMGPVFGIKGGATGGGYAQVAPMDEINLHFTGDIHAMTSANNLISACIDNHIFQGNELRIDPKHVTWNRCLDMNDRALRKATLDYSSKTQEFIREDAFDITVASEIMAIVCLSKDIKDLEERIANIIFGYDVDGKPLKVSDLKIQGAVTAILKDAIKPNLVQTLENTPAIIHGGPFANIAHGCNSIIATKTALKLADYVVTEAGFGADLGAEKFIDIKCRIADLKPSAVVLMCTLKALKYNGGVAKEDVKLENVAAVAKGFVNLKGHIENMRRFKINPIVVLNKYDFDTDKEIAKLKALCEEMGVSICETNVFMKGGEGAIELANKVVEECAKDNNDFQFLYNTNDNIRQKIHKIAVDIYGADGVEYTKQAEEAIAKIEQINRGDLPICIAKTQYSFSDNPKLLGKPTNYKIKIRDVILKNGAGFIVAIAGNIMTMPGLPKEPAAEKIYVAEDGDTIVGLF